MRAVREESFWSGEGAAAFEIDDALEFDAPGTWPTGGRQRGTAA